LYLFIYLITVIANILESNYEPGFVLVASLLAFSIPYASSGRTLVLLYIGAAGSKKNIWHLLLSQLCWCVKWPDTINYKNLSTHTSSRCINTKCIV